MRQAIRNMLALLFCATVVAAEPVEPGTQGSVSGTEVRKQPEKPVLEIQPGTSPERYSKQRLKYLNELSEYYIQTGASFQNAETLENLRKEISRQMPLTPLGKGDLRTQKQIQKEVLRQIKKEFPKTCRQYRADVVNSLGDRFKLYKPGQKIKLRYRRGENICLVKGVYYSYDGKIANVNLKKVAFIDILEEDRVKIDKAYSEARCAEYIENMVKKYRDRRNYRQKNLVDEAVEKQKERNNKLGYIELAGQWYTAEAVMKMLLSSEQARQNANMRVEHNKKKNRQTAGPVAENSVGRVVVDEVNPSAVMEKIRKHAAEDLTGPDRHQGYDAAFWGMTRGEVKYALGLNNLPLKAYPEYDEVQVSDRQLARVRLDYRRNRLFRVTVDYAISDFSELQKIYEESIAKLGPDDYQKSSNGTRGKQYTWTGKNTVIRYLLKNHPTNGTIEKFQLIKEKK